jgi:hypothetical protein
MAQAAALGLAPSTLHRWLGDPRCGSGLSPAIPGQQQPPTGIPGPGRDGTANGWYPTSQRWRPTEMGSTSAWQAAFPPLAAFCPPGQPARSSPDGIPMRPTASQTS